MEKKARIAAFDLARGLAVIFMICVHVLNQLATNQLEHDTLFGQIISFLGSTPAAPVFMTLMGASFIFAPPASVRAGVQRGLTLMATGYLLNLLRFGLPLLLAQATGYDTSATGSYTLVDLLIIIDILQFAGLSYICLTLLYTKKPKLWVVLLLAAEVAFVAPYVWGIATGIPFVDRILDLLWGNRGELVAFPLFPWLAYPLVGYAIGLFLQKATSLTQAFRQIGFASLALLVVGAVWTYTDPAQHLGDYWHTGPGGMVASVGFVGAWLWMWHLLAPSLSQTLYGDLMAFASKRVTKIYLIQWVLIGWSMLINYEQATLWPTVGIMAGMLAVSFALTWLWVRAEVKVRLADS